MQERAEGSADGEFDLAAGVADREDAHAIDPLEPPIDRRGEMKLHAARSLCLQRGDLLDGDQASLADDRGAVRDALDLAQGMGRKENGSSRGALLAQEIEEGMLLEWVEPARGSAARHPI